ncbi:hypothetical protein VA7868_04517 [Vibrio aerogenes CECT 7868]|uniref:Uncharacterized protein n=1 Tax=Vibrio aerogenes CECT 7868 TaxID=1216006 RepID=A0A1M6ETR4_9VIBR|nr:hypothetical protein VA7868_04517 [Vibrio aerogenes CECT 7868]
MRSWIKDRILLILFSVVAAIAAYIFWHSLGEHAFVIFPLIALYAYIVERPKLNKKE